MFRQGRRAGYPIADRPSRVKKEGGKRCGFKKGDGGGVFADLASTPCVQEAAVRRRGDREQLLWWRQQHADIPTKPNHVPSSVGRGRYSKALEGCVGVHTLYIDRSLGSGCDYPEEVVALYSSFANDKKFLHPILRRLQALKRKAKPRPTESAAERGELLLAIDELTAHRDTKVVQTATEVYQTTRTATTQKSECPCLGQQNPAVYIQTRKHTEHIPTRPDTAHSVVRTEDELREEAVRGNVAILTPRPPSSDYSTMQATPGYTTSATSTGYRPGSIRGVYGGRCSVVGVMI